MYTKKELQEKIDQLHTPCSDLQTMKLTVIDYKDNKLLLKITGACSGCAGAEATFEGAVKNEILRTMPGIESVELDHSMSQEILDLAKSILMKKGGDFELER